MNSNTIIIGAVLLITLYLLSSNKAASNSEYYYGDRYEAQANAEIARKQALIKQNEDKIISLKTDVATYDRDISTYQIYCDRGFQNYCNVLTNAKQTKAQLQQQITQLFQQNQTLKQGLHG